MQRRVSSEVGLFNVSIILNQQLQATNENS
jgi:hypothetical protein